MTRTEVINMANIRTENRVSAALLNLEYVNALREVCQEHRFYWRRKSVDINTVAGTATIDVATSATDLGEIIGVFWVKSDGTLAELDPVYKEQDRADAQSDTIQGEPYAYTVEQGGYGTLRLFKIPNAVYAIRVVYRAVPNVATDDSSDVIPLIPPQQHHLLEKCIEKNCLEFLFGPESPRYSTVNAQYMKLLDKAIKESRDFTSSIRRHEGDGPNEYEAVRSTN